MKNEFPSWARLGACVSFSAVLALPAFAQQNTPIETIEITSQNQGSELTAVLDPLTDASADFRDSIKRLPGMDINGNGPLTAIAQYRGLFGDRVMVNIDGAPIKGAGPNYMDSPLSHLTPGAFTQVTLYRGIAPVSVGIESLGGALVAETDISALLDDNSGFAGDVNAQTLQQGSARHYSTNLRYSQTDSFIALKGYSQKRDNSDDGRGLEQPNSFYERTGGGIEGAVQLDEHQFSGSFNIMRTKPTGTAALAMDINFVDAAWYRFNYQLDLSSQDKLLVKTYGNSNQHDMDNYSYRDVSSMMNARLNSVDSLVRGYEAQWVREQQHMQLQVGASWDMSRHNSTISNPVAQNLLIENFNQVERRRESAFVQWQDRIERVSFNLGARYTQVSGEAGEISHSMAMMNPAIASLVNGFNQTDRDRSFNLVDFSGHVSMDVADNLQLQGALARKNRAPSYTELYVWLPLGISAGMADGFNYLGNLDLQEETADQIDLGFTYQNATIHLAPRIFYQSIDNYIVGEVSTVAAANMISAMMNSNPLLQWQNVDATLWGADVVFNASLSKAWQLDMVAQWVRGTRDDLDEPLYRVSPASLTTRLSWSNESVSVMVESQLFAAQNQVSLLQNETKSSGYGLINLSSDWQVNSQFSISLGIRNLLDKTYQSHLSGVNRVSNAEVAVGERLYGLGRSVDARFQYRW